MSRLSTPGRPDRNTRDSRSAQSERNRSIDPRPRPVEAFKVVLLRGDHGPC